MQGHTTARQRAVRFPFIASVLPVDVTLHFHYIKNHFETTSKTPVCLMHPNQTPVRYVVDITGLLSFPSWTSRVRPPSPAPCFHRLTGHLGNSTDSSLLRLL